MAIGLSTMIATGPDHFRAMLAGFHAMDEHFWTAPLERKLPVLMGMLAIWYNNFLGRSWRASARLRWGTTARRTRSSADTANFGR